MANKKERMKYQVTPVDDDWTPEQGVPEIKPMPMLDINGAGVTVSLFILACAAGFAVYLVHRAFSGVSAGVMVGCLLVAALVVGAVLGMMATTLARYHKRRKHGMMIVIALAYAAAIAVGIVLGLHIPVDWTPT